MTIREKYSGSIATLPRGLFNCEQDAWAVLQGVILRHNVNIEVTDGDVRVDIISTWLRQILPESIQKDVMIFNGSDWSNRRSMVVETYKAAVRNAMWGRNFTHVFTGNLSGDQAQLFSVSEAPSMGVRIVPESAVKTHDDELLTFNFGKTIQPLEEKDATSWFEAGQVNVSHTSEARELIAAMAGMNKLASARNYNFWLVPGSVWRRIYQWANAQAFAEGRDTLRVADFLAIRYFLPTDWLDYATNQWSPELSPELYRLVEPLLRVMSSSKTHE